MIVKVSLVTRFIVAGVVPNGGHRLKKINEVIGQQVHRLEVLSTGTSPMNMQYVVNETIAATLEKIKAIVWTGLADSVA
jgi:hypothetical protein